MTVDFLERPAGDPVTGARDDRPDRPVLGSGAPAEFLDRGGGGQDDVAQGWPCCGGEEAGVLGEGIRELLGSGDRVEAALQAQSCAQNRRAGGRVGELSGESGDAAGGEPGERLEGPLLGADLVAAQGVREQVVCRVLQQLLVGGVDDFLGKHRQELEIERLRPVGQLFLFWVRQFDVRQVLSRGGAGAQSRDGEAVVERTDGGQDRFDVALV